MGKVSDLINEEAKFELTSMIDVVFLLLIFFMCAAKFKQIERRLDCFLPTEEGQMATPTELKKPEELTIFVKDNQVARASSDYKISSVRNATFFLASRDATPVHDPMEFLSRIQALASNPEQEVLITLYNEDRDKDQMVPFFNIVKCIDVCKIAGIQKIKFQAPAQPL